MTFDWPSAVSSTRPLLETAPEHEGSTVLEQLPEVVAGCFTSDGALL